VGRDWQGRIVRTDILKFTTRSGGFFVGETTMPIVLPKKYGWLANEPGPRLLVEMLLLHGTIEATGPADNPMILKWAKDIGLGHIYQHDAIAWCGLTVAYAAAQAGWGHAPRGNALWARNWLAWGNPVDLGKEMLSDVLVFARGTSGHVGLYVGEDKDCFHVLGGNQGDAVSIKRIPKARLISGRQCPWRVSRPANVRKVYLDSSGAVSVNEA
jgi:uncharacterized protein (TIGR02594 family)